MKSFFSVLLTIVALSILPSISYGQNIFEMDIKTFTGIGETLNEARSNAISRYQEWIFTHNVAEEGSSEYYWENSCGFMCTEWVYKIDLIYFDHTVIAAAEPPHRIDHGVLPQYGIRRLYG